MGLRRDHRRPGPFGRRRLRRRLRASFAAARRRRPDGPARAGWGRSRTGWGRSRTRHGPYHPRVLLIVDLDGVVYRGPDPIPGVPELLRRRVAAGDVIVYATNNSSRHRSDYEAILTSIGAPVSMERIVTSARATALYLRECNPAVSVALALGGPGLRRE